MLTRNAMVSVIQIFTEWLINVFLSVLDHIRKKFEQEITKLEQLYKNCFRFENYCKDCIECENHHMMDVVQSNKDIKNKKDLTFSRDSVFKLKTFEC